jgi:hypothetical protein
MQKEVVAQNVLFIMNVWIIIMSGFFALAEVPGVVSKKEDVYVCTAQTKLNIG